MSRSRLTSICRQAPRLASHAPVGRKRSHPLAALLFVGSAIGGTSFCVSHTESSPINRRTLSRGGHVLATSASGSNDAPELSVEAANPRAETRTHLTKADRYFQLHKSLPLPTIVHDRLDRLLSDEALEEDNPSGARSYKILVVGDVHGCLEELVSLVDKATQLHNEGKQFTAVVLVGDLGNKGPFSAEVVRYVRTRPRWFAVRGNHDDAALRAALGDEDRRSQPKYQWVKSLSDKDIDWMAELPYTITIPRSMLGGAKDAGSAGQDVIVVHAGFDTVVPLEGQETSTMITLRNLTIDGKMQAWARAWRGPEFVIFGHDAKRGLQREEYAIGLDSGCVYGKKLTGMILPERELVSVDAVGEHCPIKKKT